MFHDSPGDCSICFYLHVVGWLSGLLMNPISMLTGALVPGRVRQERGQTKSDLTTILSSPLFSLSVPFCPKLSVSLCYLVPPFTHNRFTITYH